MDIVNPTGDTIRGGYDGVPYVFPPRKILVVGDEAGRHLINTCGRFGLVEVHFGDDPEKIRYAGLHARILYYRQTLDGHEAVNARQAEMKFPPIPDSDAVRQARVALPIYEKFCKVMEERLGQQAMKAYERDLERILAGDVEAPSLNHMTIDDLRAEASRLGIDWKPEWSPIELREAIGHRVTAPQIAPVMIPSPSGSASIPGPMPGVAPEGLDGGFSY